MDVILILETLSQHGLVKLNKQANEWYSVYCPFHNDSNPSCGVSLQTQVRNGQTYPEGFWHCFSCSAAYTMEDGVSKILENHNIKMTGREWLVKYVPGYEPESDFDYLIPNDLMDTIQNKYALNHIQAQLHKTPTYITEAELASYRYIVPYMYERKLTDELIEKYDIGYDANWIPPGRKKPVPCITIPVRDKEGHTLFFCRRSIQGKIFNYPEGVEKPVYGLDMIPSNTKSIVICESCLDALTAVSYGYPAVALLGTGNSYQMKQLKELGCTEFVICTDGDTAGRRAANKLKKALRSVAIVWTVEMPEDKDVNDLTKPEFDKLYKERV